MFDARFHLILFFCEPAVGRPFFVKVFCLHHQSQGFRTSADDVVVYREVGIAGEPVPRFDTDGPLETRGAVVLRHEGYDIAASLGARERDAPEHEMRLMVGTIVNSFPYTIHEFVKRLAYERKDYNDSVGFVRMVLRMVLRMPLAWVISPSCRFRARRDCALQVFALRDARSLFYALEASCRFQAGIPIALQLLMMLDSRNLFLRLVASRKDWQYHSHRAYGRQDFFSVHIASLQSGAWLSRLVQRHNRQDVVSIRSTSRGRRESKHY